MCALRLTILAILLVCSVSCSYEDKHSREVIVEQAVNRFRSQVNEGRYHEIYQQADADMQSRIGEPEFVAQLEGVHQQIGNIDSKAMVVIDGGLWKELRRGFHVGPEIVPDSGLLAGDIGIGSEKSLWILENNQAKLVSFQFKFLCKKPCQIGFGIGPK